MHLTIVNVVFHKKDSVKDACDIFFHMGQV